MVSIDPLLVFFFFSLTAVTELGSSSSRQKASTLLRLVLTGLGSRAKLARAAKSKKSWQNRTFFFEKEETERKIKKI